MLSDVADRSPEISSHVFFARCQVSVRFGHIGEDDDAAAGAIGENICFEELIEILEPGIADQACNILTIREPHGRSPKENGKLDPAISSPALAGGPFNPIQMSGDLAPPGRASPPVKADRDQHEGEDKRNRPKDKPRRYCLSRWIGQVNVAKIAEDVFRGHRKKPPPIAWASAVSTWRMPRLDKRAPSVRR